MENKITFKCNKCNAIYENQDVSLIGKRVQCDCGEKFICKPIQLDNKNISKTKEQAQKKPKQKIYTPPSNEKQMELLKKKKDMENITSDVPAEKFWTKDTRDGCLLITIVGALILWGGYSCFSGCRANNAKYNAERQKYGDKIQAKMLCEDRILAMLKSPSTANIKFESQEDFQGTFRFSGYIDAQNSFGAMLRSRFSAKIQYKDGKYSFVDFSIK